MKREADLLDRLLAQHWAGHVSAKDAAKLCTMRASEFRALSRGRLQAIAVETEAWRYYVQEFNYRFPWCDRRTMKQHSTERVRRNVRRFPGDTAPGDVLEVHGADAELHCMAYPSQTRCASRLDAELMRTPMQRRTNGNETKGEASKIENGITLPGNHSRAPLRVTERHSFKGHDEQHAPTWADVLKGRGQFDFA